MTNTKIAPRGNHHMRTFCSFVIAISLTVSSTAWADPLAAGKPAGVHQAQEMGGKEWLVLGGLAAAGIGVAIATSGGRSSNTQNLPVTVITTSATSP
jgi:hypothetical protein